MRIKRHPQENARIGFPTAEERMEVLESAMMKLLNGPDKVELTEMIAKMDKLDVDFPDFMIAPNTKGGLSAPQRPEPVKKKPAPETPATP